MDKQKILVVDDEPDMRIFVSTVVETMGFAPVTAENGTKALEKARAAVPVLVILDIMMPKIEDGILAYQQFKANEKLAHIPIIMLSAIARKTFFHYIRMLSPPKGPHVPEPEAYMEKPPDAAELIEMIENLLTNTTQS